MRMASLSSPARSACTSSTALGRPPRLPRRRARGHPPARARTAQPARRVPPRGDPGVRGLPRPGRRGAVERHRVDRSLVDASGEDGEVTLARARPAPDRDLDVRGAGEPVRHRVRARALGHPRAPRAQPPVIVRWRRRAPAAHRVGGCWSWRSTRPRRRSRSPSATARDVLAEWSVVDPRRHGELLAPGIERVLAEARVRPADLDAIAVGVGPGPFTSLRVGVVTARTLGAVLGDPGARRLHARRDRAARRSGSTRRSRRRSFMVATDARRREVYWARYEGGGGSTDPAWPSPPSSAGPARSSATARRSTRTTSAGARGPEHARAAAVAAYVGRRPAHARAGPALPAQARRHAVRRRRSGCSRDRRSDRDQDADPDLVRPADAPHRRRRGDPDRGRPAPAWTRGRSTMFHDAIDAPDRLRCASSPAAVPRTSSRTGSCRSPPTSQTWTTSRFAADRERHGIGRWLLRALLDGRGRAGRARGAARGAPRQRSGGRALRGRGVRRDRPAPRLLRTRHRRDRDAETSARLEPRIGRLRTTAPRGAPHA